MWATIAIGAEGNTMSGKFEWRARLGAGWNFHSDRTIDGFDIDFGAKSGINHRNLFFGKNDDAVTSEVFVRFDMNYDIEIAFAAALLWSIATSALPNRPKKAPIR